MGIEDFIRDALLLPNDLIAYHVGRELTELYPGKAIVEGQNWYFDLEAFVKAERCFIAEDRSVFTQVRNEWEGINKKQKQIMPNAWLHVLWKDRLFEVVLVSWAEGCFQKRHQWIVADERQFADAFFDAVCEFSCEVRGEILVYRDGFFEKNKELFTSIRSATFSNLILEEKFKHELQSDFRCFFESRDIYERYGIPWKRGAILIGPPGNGKTHTVKALINQLQKPCIYVRSFKADYGTEQERMAEVFERARMTAPCVVVLEDLDAMISDDNRAFFLNELDGFEVNAGVVVIATTNHPEKLDPAILDRPSRFDRKYHFNLPDESGRLAYLKDWNEELQVEMRLSEAVVPTVVASTSGFSFAYLKELFLSSMVQWMAEQREGAMDQIVTKQVGVLRGQMTAETAEATRRRFKLFKRA
jgi:AAA+ superfamily predicted ATPase